MDPLRAEYLYCYLKDRPEEFKDTLELTKQLIKDESTAYVGSTTKEKRDKEGGSQSRMEMRQFC